MPGLRGFVARDRRVLRMAGANAREVLQGVVTNDVQRLAPGRAVYAALLTPQGKYLFDFFLVDGGEAVLIDVAADRAEALAQRLRMYCLRRDARIEGDTGLSVALIWGEGAPPDGAIPDPRLPALGWRLYAEAPALDRMEPASPADYLALRVAHQVPETGVELVPDDSFILEAGFERLNGVDFRKGCYVGQEVTARMKHKTELRKRLVPVRVEGAAPPGTPITSDGKPAGTLYSHHGGRGLAHLRLDRATGEMEAGGARVIYEE
ncbi:folate-binding protein [Limibaculum sp. FT325]|uniref:CAF17-like 4Fe-4S cluster assembly/insertion protein YgfZ n=1 Tax=Thermohalobaculum sediminis TaxID=2939436 RepID=UPI0020BDE271|nr:folate-binding protein [Limibaculum sediminis]MCL5776696.1 folate-binding protein [Limibaculum sediminis]